jgi:hypothetical protein
MCPLHDVHNMSAYRANDVRLSVLMFQLENCWTDFDMNVTPAVAGHSKFVLFNFVQSVVTAWRTHEFVRWRFSRAAQYRVLKLRMVTHVLKIYNFC